MSVGGHAQANWNRDALQPMTYPMKIKPRTRRNARWQTCILLLCCTATLLVSFPATAQDSLLDRIRSGMRGIAKGVDFVGQKADDLLGPGLDPGAEPAARFSEQVDFSERYPVDATPVLALSNQFGEIRIETWSDPVVQIQATIVVGADSAEVATELANATVIQVNATKEVVECHTVLPEVKREMGPVSTRVDYTISVPRGANLVLDNFFGDTYVRKADGLVAIEAQYGAVRLDEIGGPLTVRTHGDFPVEANKLAQGGTFDINGGYARFADVGGKLRINGFRTNVTIAVGTGELDIEASSESGPIQLILPPGAQPDLTAAVRYGTLNSTIPLTRSVQGRRILGRLPSESPLQRINLSATFGDISIEQEATSGEAPPAEAPDAKPFSDVVTHTLACASGAVLQIQAIRGDIRVEPSEGAEAVITATRVAWVQKPLDAPGALSALEVQTDQSPERCAVTTLTTADMGQLGCAAYQVNLLVRVPAGVAVRVVAAEGQTRVEKIAAPVTVTQTAGSVRATDCAGSLELTNQNGEVVVERASGAVVASALYGDCVVNQSTGTLNLQCREGKTIVDGAGAGVTIRNNGGDVRILALGGVGGAYDVRAENASIRLLLNAEADATLTMLATEGEVHSVYPLQGSINGPRKEFSGRLKEGLQEVRLETQNGNIYLD